jgi:programmed cell death 6-interacting protein
MNEFRVSFRWQDGFRTSKIVMSNCMYVDWACFVWNLAALESQLGSKIERATDEGIKTANKHFQQAAGYFDFIITRILPQCTGSLLVGLSQNAILMSRDLMLSQAQLCFYEKVNAVYYKF